MPALHDAELHSAHIDRVGHSFSQLSLIAEGCFSTGRIMFSVCAVMRLVRDEKPFAIDAAVILPEHLHMLMTLPAGDSDYSFRIGEIKCSTQNHFMVNLLRTNLGDIVTCGNHGIGNM